MGIFVKGNSECPIKRGRPSTPLLPRNPMLLSQLVRWGLHPTWLGQVPPTHRFRLCDLEAGNFLDRLNPDTPSEAYKSIAFTRFFVDKTWLVHDILQSLKPDNQRYICITRPRRFGKTVMANMIEAFFGKTTGCPSLFEHLEISIIIMLFYSQDTWQIFYLHPQAPLDQGKQTVLRLQNQKAPMVLIFIVFRHFSCFFQAEISLLIDLNIYARNIQDNNST